MVEEDVVDEVAVDDRRGRFSKGAMLYSNDGSKCSGLRPSRPIDVIAVRKGCMKNAEVVVEVVVEVVAVDDERPPGGTVVLGMSR